MKKTTNWEGYDKDKQRLQDMVEPQYGFSYKTGYMVVADMRDYKLYIEEKYYNKNFIKIKLYPAFDDYFSSKPNKQIWLLN